MKKSLNPILVIFIYLIILNHISRLISSAFQIPMAIFGYYSLPITIFNMVLGVTMIVTLIGLLRIKKWAIYFFCGIQVFTLVVNTMITGDFFVHLFVTVFLCGVMAALLCLRRNGASAWSLFFPYITQNTDEEICNIKGGNPIEMQLKNEEQNILEEQCQ